MQNTCCHGTGIETNTHTLNNYLRGPCGKQTTSKELRCVLLKVTQCLWAEPEGIITARALGNQHMRTVCSPCAQSTPITSARHMKPPLLQRDRDPDRQSEDHRQREAKMDVESYHFYSSFHKPVCFIRVPSLSLSIVTQSFPKYTHIIVCKCV